MLDGFRAEKRMLRTQIRNYIVIWKTDLDVNYNMNIPENIKNMSKKEFDSWLKTVSRIDVPKQLKDLLVQYDCACESIENFSI